MHWMLALFILPLTAFSIFWSIVLLRRRTRGFRLMRWIFIAALMCAFEACLVDQGQKAAHRWDGAELNPEVTREQMVGTWRFRQEWVTLSADGSFTCNDGLRGSWDVQNGQFQSNLIPPREWKWPLAVIRDNGRVVLLKPPGTAPIQTRGIATTRS